MTDPRVGEMILYDYIRPSLLDGEYRMRLGTEVAIKSAASGAFEPQALDGQDLFFNVEGPRFSLAPTEVVAVFPPRNGHGPFDSALPHVALGRRTLPWERPLAAAYTAGPDETPFPFLALLLLEESEFEIRRNMVLSDVVPTAVFQRLGSPTTIRCDAIEADEALLRSLLPMPSELKLLTHVRHVNVDDRELSAGDSDGYFAVVMSNRVPRSGAKYAACLVSVEERTDLLPTTDPAAGFDVGHVFVDVELGASDFEFTSALSPKSLGTSILAVDVDKLSRFQTTPAVKQAALGADLSTIILRPKARLVLLHSWTFTCEGDGTFRQLMQNLDVGMIGDVDPARKLAVTDTGHLKIDVVDRLGAPEQSWYRGPLVGQPLTRDPLGPYHSADQARRLVVDTGAEDVTYASAFEVGRLLAAADARLAQELMRWRRGAYRSSSRKFSIELLQAKMRLTAITNPLDPVALRYAVNILAKVASGAGPLADPFGVELIAACTLLQPKVVAAAFGLASEADASVLLGLDASRSATITFATPQTAQTLDAVLKDIAGLVQLGRQRARILDNTHINLKGERL